MPRVRRMPAVWLVAALIMIVSLHTSTAYGHARREVGPYRFVVGFLVEPAYEGLKNGVDLRVFKADTEVPVEGLQDTLQAEVTHVPSTVKKLASPSAAVRERRRHKHGSSPRLLRRSAGLSG